MVRVRAVLVGAWPRKHFSHWLSQSQLNMHFRCRVWQAQILDVTHCRWLLAHPCYVYKVIWHENAIITCWHLLWSSCHLLLKLLYLLSAASAILNSSTGDLMIWYGNQFYLLKAVIWFLPAKAILTFNTEVTAWVGKTLWRNFSSSPVVLNLLLKACMNGVSTVSGGIEFQLFMTDSEGEHFLTQAGTSSKLFELL